MSNNERLIGGIPESEYRRRQALPSRPLTPADVRNEPWRDKYSAHLLREDGAVLMQGFRGVLWVGSVNDEGSIDWDQA
jgi:hypothetical protein